MTFLLQTRICHCKNACEKLDLERKKQLFEQFYKVDYDGQTMLLRQYMDLVEVKRRYVEEDISRRTCSFTYSLPVGSTKIKVCQKILCSVLKVTPRRIQKLQEKIKFNEALADQRGKHRNRPLATPDAVKVAVREHIESFPKEMSHYSRNNTQKLILHPDLSIKKMYLLFKAKFPNLRCSENLYRNIFNSDFNLRFGAPRSDTCARCDKLYTQLVCAQSNDEIRNTEIESQLHHAKAEKAYSTLNKDIDSAKNDSNIIVLATDLQQVLFCPTLKHSNVFYQRQYSCYNQAIHNMGTNEGFMCLWHETVAKRGSAETTSCLLKYIITNFKPMEKMERKLIVWSDRCVGQNNNWRSIALYQYLVTMKYFTSVEQKFLISGHSFLPCDRDFALIERKKKTATIYHPKEWIEVIANARPSKPFNVCYMDRNDFKDLSIVESSLLKNKTKITEAVWYKISSDDPTNLFSRESHNVLRPWTTHLLAKKARGVKNRCLPPVAVPVERLPALYKNPLPVKKEKKSNLVDMCAYIPNQEYKEFYLNLPAMEN